MPVAASALAARAPHAGALADAGFLEPRAALFAGLAAAAVDQQLLFEVAGQAVRTDEVPQGGAAAFDCVGQDALHRDHQPLVTLPRLLAGGAQRMDAGLDTGAVVSTHHYAIKNTDTATDVHDALAVLGAHAIVADLQQLQQTGRLNASPQPQAGITYAQKLSKEEAKIDWNQPALIIERKIRAFNPVPGAWVEYQNQPLKIWQAEAVEQSGRAGEVLAISSDGLIVACGEGALNITELQPAGSKRMPVAAFAAGRHIEKGTPL